MPICPNSQPLESTAITVSSTMLQRTRSVSATTRRYAPSSASSQAPSRRATGPSPECRRRWREHSIGVSVSETHSEASTPMLTTSANEL